MTRNRPKIIPINFGLKVDESSSDNNDSNPKFMIKSEELNNVDEVIDNNVKIAKEAIEKINIDSVLKSIKKDSIGIQGARIYGTYQDYITFLMNKHISNNKLVEGEVIMLDC